MMSKIKKLVKVYKYQYSIYINKIDRGGEVIVVVK